jgi:hypothetical protein
VANLVDVQILEDGWRDTVGKIVLIADTSNITQSVIFDPATLFQTFPVSDRLSINEIQYSIQDGWTVQLYWDGSPVKRIVDLAGRGMFPVDLNFGGLQNDAHLPTGKITLSTLGWSGTKVATLIVHCIKQWSGGSSTGQVFLGQENGFLLVQEDLSQILVT